MTSVMYGQRARFSVGRIGPSKESRRLAHHGHQPHRFVADKACRVRHPCRSGKRAHFPLQHLGIEAKRQLQEWLGETHRLILADLLRRAKMRWTILMTSPEQQ